MWPPTPPQGTPRAWLAQQCWRDSRYALVTDAKLTQVYVTISRDIQQLPRQKALHMITLCNEDKRALTMVSLTSPLTHVFCQLSFGLPDEDGEKYQDVFSKTPFKIGFQVNNK